MQNRIKRTGAVAAALTLLSLTLAPAAQARSDLWREKGSAERHAVPLPSLSPVVKGVSGAVLTITTEAMAQNSGMQVNPFGIPGFHFQIPNHPQKGAGSGFIIHPSGLALTNFHVVENATDIKVKVGKGNREYEAKVVGTDPKTDVALIQIESDRKDWSYIPLGDSGALEVGDFVIAIGNPFGLSLSVSSGIISSQHRRDINPSGRRGLYDFLQTDASINPGNSGGPLVNLFGEVVGINSATNMAGDGIGFAIPINLVKQLLPQLKDRGSVERSWIGVGIRQVTGEVAKGFGMKRARGALVAEVVADGPAERAGIEPGDVITKFDGTPIEESAELPMLAGHAGVGRTVEIELLRDGHRKVIDLKLGRLPSDDSVVAHAGGPVQGRLGIAVRTLDREAREALQLPAKTRGVVVVGLQPGSRAMAAGLQRDDVIIKVNRTKIRSVHDFQKAVAKIKKGKFVRLLVKRKGATVFVGMTMP